MKVDWRTELPMWLLLAGMFALAISTWSVAPERIPVHWGWSGQPDRWGGRLQGLMLQPLVALGLYGLLLFLPRIDPGRANYETFSRPYAVLRLVVMLAQAAIQTLVVLNVRGVHVQVGIVAPLVVGALFVVLGNLLGKIRPNWFVGIRTPWTLSSKESWARTHRAGGWVFIGAGLLLMTLAAVHRLAWTLGVVALIGIAVLGLVVYSFVVWRSDPEKSPPAGTTPAGPGAA